MAKIKKEMTKWERAEVAANLSAIAYMNATKGQKASKAKGFTKARLIAKDGAEVLVAYSPTTLWFAFRGTEPSKLNDVLADLKVLKRKAQAGGRVHSGFQDEVDELWDDLKLELIKKVVKKIGKGIKKVVKKIGGAFGKLGILGHIGLMFLMPYASQFWGSLGKFGTTLVNGTNIAGKALGAIQGFLSEIYERYLSFSNDTLSILSEGRLYNGKMIL